jgi:hypothetical protein
MADETAKIAPTASVLPCEPSKLRKAKETLKEPSKIRNWYFDYIASDYMFTSVYVAVLLTIKVYFNLDWTRFFDGITLFYVIFAGVTISKVGTTVCNYYNKKAKLMELIANTNDLRNVRL